MHFDTVIAIDWSGSRNLTAQRKKIWACKAVIHDDTAEIVALEGGRSREEILAWLNSPRTDGQAIVVGLDFAFSFPVGFEGHEGTPRRLSGRSWPEYLAYAAEFGEQILSACPGPYWGLGNRKRHDDATFRRFSSGARLRRTDRVAARGSASPKEIFQLGGAGHVGTGSLRGMPLLKRLRASGWAVWPFDESNDKTIVEIYPGCLYERRVKKSDISAREEYLRVIKADENSRITVADPWLWARALASDDAFDAFVSCVAMAKNAMSKSMFAEYQDRHPDDVGVEGWIWGALSW